MSLLRSYIQQILKENFDDDDDFNDIILPAHQQIFDQLGVETIPRGQSQTGFLGMGGYSFVYEIIYKDKHAVIKISEDDNEFYASQKMISLREKTPNWVKKHLPVIYDVKEFKIKSVETSLRFTHYYVTILEYLKPMHQSVQDLVFSFKGETKSRYADEIKKTIISKRDELKRNVINSFVLYYNHKIKQNKSQKKLQVNELKNLAVYLTNYVIDNIDNFDKGDDPVAISKLRNELIRVTNNWSTDDNFIFIDFHKFNLTNIVIHTISNKFPLSSNYDNKNNVFADPKMQSLYDTVRYLNSKKIATWDDLHNENVMIRPKTGDYVISDYGLFDWYE